MYAIATARATTTICVAEVISEEFVGVVGKKIGGKKIQGRNCSTGDLR